MTGFEFSDEYTSFSRGTDGSPALKLGPGLALAIAPDAGHALTISPRDSTRLSLLSAGAGEPRSLSGPPGAENALFAPDGDSILVQARQADQRTIHRLDLATSRSELLFGIDGPGVFSRRGAPWAISPDGRRLAIQGADGAVRAWPLAGGEPSALLPANPKEKLLRSSSRYLNSLYLVVGLR